MSLSDMDSLNPTTRILVAGEHGSGTTWAFNIIRMVMCWRGLNPVSGWLEQKPSADIIEQMQKTNWIIKTHGFPGLSSFLRAVSPVITIRTARNLGDCVRSVQRRTKFDKEKCSRIVKTDAAYLGNLRFDGAVYFIVDGIGSAHAAKRALMPTGLKPTEDEIKNLVQLFSKDSVRQFVAGIQEGAPDVVKDKRGMLYDKNTLFQQNHVG